MAKYDGLIIPRSYNDYINKSDPIGVSQALALNGVMDAAPTENSEKPAKSGGIYAALAGKQPALTFDDVPTDGSINPVKSSGIYDALVEKQNTLTFDNTPTENSDNPVKSGGIYAALGDINAAFNTAFLDIECQLANIPRITPKDITSYVTDGTLWQRLNGTNGFKLYEDLRVGDYIKMSRPISAYEQTGKYQTTGSQYVTIAGIDTLMYKGDQGSGINYHHLVMVPGQGFGGTQHFGCSRMNASNTTAGGYVGSEMNATTIGAVVSSGSTAATASINQQLYAEFGAHLKTIRAQLSNSINTSGVNRYGTADGCSNNWAWTSVQAVLLSEIECYGSIVWSSSGYDTGEANKQLPLFAYIESARNNRSAYYWLKDIASAVRFCYSGNDGNSSGTGASYANLYVRPRFVIG